MTGRTAKLFINGGSQAVRLPAEFRFEGTEEVFVRRDAVTGDIVLSTKPVDPGWVEFFALRDQAGLPADVFSERRLNEPLTPRDPFEAE